MRILLVSSQMILCWFVRSLCSSVYVFRVYLCVQNGIESTTMSKQLEQPNNRLTQSEWDGGKNKTKDERSTDIGRMEVGTNFAIRRRSMNVRPLYVYAMYSLPEHNCHKQKKNRFDSILRLWFRQRHKANTRIHTPHDDTGERSIAWHINVALFGTLLSICGWWCLACTDSEWANTWLRHTLANCDTPTDSTQIEGICSFYFFFVFVGILFIVVFFTRQQHFFSFLFHFFSYRFVERKHIFSFSLFYLSSMSLELNFVVSRNIIILIQIEVWNGNRCELCTVARLSDAQRSTRALRCVDHRIVSR